MWLCASKIFRLTFSMRTLQWDAITTAPLAEADGQAQTTSPICYAVLLMNGISDKPEHLAHAEQTIGRPAGKDALNEEFARIAKAFASPRRVELLELLAQGERSVETLAAEAGMSITSSSAHLQVLRRACLVGTRREGTRVFYRLAGDDVYRLLADVRSLAYERLAEVDRAARSYLGEPGSIELVSREALEERLAAKNVVLVDLRPSEEYAAGHIPGALSIPHRDLEARLSELPAGAEIVTYCRGPFCVLAAQGIALLRQRGLNARRLEDGFPEWRLSGRPIATGGLP
jgi:rhodanese-related sulfurtransferase/DNA-binding transcriptional ArsR family regulator